MCVARISCHAAIGQNLRAPHLRAAHACAQADLEPGAVDARYSAAAAGISFADAATASKLETCQHRFRHFTLRCSHTRVTACEDLAEVQDGKCGASPRFPDDTSSAAHL